MLVLGRAAFFGSVDVDLPLQKSPLLRADDLTPQFGYVGPRYAETRVLLLGISPGNGAETETRSPADARMMPAVVRFAEMPTRENFIAAQAAYRAECETWPVWRRHCKEVIGAGKLSLDQVAYSNCLPYRTGSNSAFQDAVAAKAAELYARPLIAELQAKLVIALGKRAAEILGLAGPIPAKVITWNRTQAATAAVIADRERTAAAILASLASDE